MEGGSLFVDRGKQTVDPNKGVGEKEAAWTRECATGKPRDLADLRMSLRDMRGR